MKIFQIGDAEIIRNQEPVEAPLVSQNVIEQMLVAVRWDTVNLVVGSHHASNVTLLHRVLEGSEKVLADYALGIAPRRNIRAAFGLAVYSEMFRSGHHVSFVEERLVSLQAQNRGKANMRDKVRVFAVGLFGAPPAGIASKIQNRGQALLRSPGASFGSRRGKNILDQRRVPRGGQRDGLRVRSSFRRTKTVQTLFVKKDGNAQAGIFLQPFLNGVGELRHLARPTVLARPRHFSQAILQHQPGTIRLERALLIDEKSYGKLAVLPGALQLRHLFFQSHARKQIGYALFNWPFGVAVRVNLLGKASQSHGQNC